MGVQSGEHAANGVLEEGLVLDGLHVVVLDLGENLRERAEILQWEGAVPTALCQDALAGGEQRTHYQAECQ